MLCDEYGLVFAFLRGRGPTLWLHSIRVVGQLRWAGGHGTIQEESLEVVEQPRVFLGEEGNCYSSLASTTCSSNPVRVVLNALGHVVVDHHGNIPGGIVYTVVRAEDGTEHTHHRQNTSLFNAYKLTTHTS